MAVKRGYKQTEVGVIPEDWGVKSLGELCSYQNGTSLERLFNNNDGFKVISIGNYSPSGKYIETNTYINHAHYNVVKRFVLNKNDLTMILNDKTSAGTILGRVLLIETNGQFVFNQRTMRLTTNKGVLPLFLYHAINGDYIHSIIVSLAKPGTQIYINTNDVLNLKIPLPPLAEQQAIAEALSDVDGLISALDALIAKKRAIKQGAMQELLTGQRRLPGFAGEWAVRKLGECLLTTPEYGINAPAVPYSDTLPIYLRITDITDDGTFSPEKITSVENVNSGRYLLDINDVVFARTGASTGKTYLHNRKDGIMAFAGFLIRVKTDPSKLLASYLAYYSKTEAYRNWVTVMSMRSGQPGINGNEYSQLPILLPSIPEQTAIAQILADLDGELAALAAKRAKTVAVKAGMMQTLLTGQVRLV